MRASNAAGRPIGAVARDVKFKGSGRLDAGSAGRAVPGWALWCAFLISFTLPNLVFSGRYFFDTLHLMKWTVTMVPIGILVVIAGARLVLNGARRLSFGLDLFGFIWMALLIIITLEPLYIDLSSMSTFAKEWFYFASLFAVYFISYNCFRSRALLKAVLIGGCVNAAINVIFAELLIRNLNAGYPFILDVPGNYIGNTAQQEMFGLWMAMTVLNGVFLHLDCIDGLKEGERAHEKPFFWINITLLAINAWGLWSSTARGAILSLAVAFASLALCLWAGRRKRALKSAFIMMGVVGVFVAVVLAASAALETGRGAGLVGKMQDMIHNPTSIGGRASIWRTSEEVFLKAPILGVGLGQYKWHFLDGQRIMYEKYPELYNAPGYNWQFTYWAHSEYIQWFCETGLAGGILLSALGIWWLASFVIAIARRKELPQEAIWGIAMTFLLWFDALFSRPFHRIENSVWMALAFALSNRYILADLVKSINVPERISGSLWRAFGAVTLGAAVYGFYFLAGGIEGDQLIFKAITQRAGALEKQALLKKAEANLMSRDDAREQLAELFVTVGKVQNDNGIIDHGIREMLEAYKRRPTSKLLFQVLGYAQERNDQAVLRELARYLSPSMYTVQTPAVQSGEASPEASSVSQEDGD